ncbi:enterin neuropeptides-like [Tigriopus californicus]|uniref:enterin neuropeptides-like n=1 Tax=Tigriopus californicus TaxID=6832 RepID=UPI0027D9D09E|nr:enterin neuropeptides-like [Tigriopus californicus]
MLPAKCWIQVNFLGFCLILVALGTCQGFEGSSSEEDLTPRSLPFFSFLFNRDVDRRSGNTFSRGTTLGSEFLGRRKRVPGSEFLGKRVPGSEFLGKRAPGSEFLGKRAPGSEFLGKRSPGSEFLGKRTPGSEFLGKRTPGSEFLGKRAPGSEFLGKRAPGSEFLGKRTPGSEFLGKRAYAEDEDLQELFHQLYSAHKRMPEVPMSSGQSDRDLNWERIQSMIST